MWSILKPIVIRENALYIKSALLKLYRLFNCAVKDVRLVMAINEKVPTLTVYEDDKKLAEYVIEPLNSNPDLSGQYLHMSISVTEDAVLFIDGKICQRRR